MLEELSFSDSTVCTLPIYNDEKDSSSCRKCKNQNNWRCDDGFCIPIEKYRDGIPHCEDGSDEKPGMLLMFALVERYLIFVCDTYNPTF